MRTDPSIERDLDRAVEAGLREQTRREACPSMDVIAAYCERALVSDELARWEEHFAGCRHCQQILASIARVEPTVPPAEAPSLWSRAFDWRWLVPATAAATAVTIWIAVRPTSAPDRASPVVALQDRARANAPAAPDDTQRFAQPAQEKAPEPRAPAAAPEQAPLSKKEAAKAAEPTPPPVESADRLSRRDAAALGQTTGLAATPPATPPPAAARAPEMKPLAESIAAAADTASRQTGVHVAPDVRVRWRVGPGGQVSRSRDEGVTWEPQSSGTNRDLLAGSAPSENVFWVVGRGGAILRTTDGQSFSPVDSPAASDIVRILATNELSAVITTDDNQRFITRDGGKTWEKQEQF